MKSDDTEINQKYIAIEVHLHFKSLLGIKLLKKN